MTIQRMPVDISGSQSGAKVATLTLDQPGRPVVVIVAGLLEELDATLDDLPPDLDGFILASGAPRAFVAGADLKAIMALGDAELHTYLESGARVFQRIADLPCPTAAAIHSVALGGGLELAMHCDGLIGVIDPEAKPYPIGLPEAGLKICPGWGGTNLLPARIDPETAIIAAASGIPFKSDDADALGLFDRTCTSRMGLIATASDWISEQHGPGRTGKPSRCVQTMDTDRVEAALNRARAELTPSLHADAVLDAIQTGINKGWNAALDSERNHLVKLRHTPPAAAAIGAFFAKSSPGKPANK